MASRNEIRDALFTRLQDRVSVKFATTRYLTSDDLTSDARQPALVLRVTGYVPQYEEGCDTTWQANYVVGLYVRNVAKDGSSDDALNDLVDEVEAALDVQVGEDGETQTTLGNKCRRAYVSDEVEFEPGETTDQAMALVPITVEV